MKVLFINTIDKSGSTGRIVRQLGEIVEKNGGSYMVAFGRGRETDEHAYRIGTDAELYAHAVLSRITDRAGFYSQTATKRLVEKIREFAPDVIHMHNLHGYYLHLPTLFAFLKKEYTGKAIWTLHDCWAFTGHCVHYTYAKCGKWKTGCDHCPEKKRYPASFLRDGSRINFEKKKALLRGIPNMTIVTPSVWLAEQVKQSFLWDYPVEVIPNGVDLEQFHASEKSGEKIVLNVADGRDDRKGYGDLVRLGEMLPPEYRIVMVGLSKKDCKKVPRYIQARQRTDSVQKLAAWYGKALCLVNPTYEDNFPTVNLEALACGTPVITYRSGGSPESLTDDCGTVVEPGDVEGLRDAILACQFSPEKCRQRAESFRKEIKFSEYYTLYES